MTQPVSFPSETVNFSIPLLVSGQAQKEFFLNEAMVVIDSLLQRAVTSSLPSPPEGAWEGECFRVIAEATGDWAGREGQIAIRIGGSWHFVSPADGLTLYDRGAAVILHHFSGWNTASEPSTPNGGSTIDAEARAALAELVETLRNVGILPRSA